MYMGVEFFAYQVSNGVTRSKCFKEQEAELLSDSLSDDARGY